MYLVVRFNVELQGLAPRGRIISTNFVLAAKDQAMVLNIPVKYNNPTTS
jgi:hypothetical protein